jgi:hypothetical protein
MTGERLGQGDSSGCCRVSNPYKSERLLYLINKKDMYTGTSLYSRVQARLQHAQLWYDQPDSSSTGMAGDGGWQQSVAATVLADILTLTAIQNNDFLRG